MKSIIRRLTPVETSRLMGFNGDDYLDVDGAQTPDSPRYKACGNSWGVNSAEWVNFRIERVLRELGYAANDRAIQYATTCSGVEAHSQAVKDCAWHANFFSEIEKFPCRVLAYRYPHVPNLGDMTKVDGTKYDLDVFSGGTPCWCKGAYVLCREGYKPIEDVCVGDMVMTHLGRWRKVLKVGNKKSKNIVSVKVGGRPEFKVTSDHKFFVGVDDNGNASFKSISDIGVGGVICVPPSGFGFRTVDVPEFPKVYCANKEQIAELAGWYVGDGYTRRWKNKKKVAVILCLNDEKLKVFEERFGGVINYSKCGRIGNEQPIQICCTELALWLEKHFSKKSEGKKIPAWMFCKYAEYFMNGYGATDGHITKYGSFSATTVSPFIAYAVSHMLGRSCVNSNDYSFKQYNDRISYCRHRQYGVNKSKNTKTFIKHGNYDATRVLSIASADAEVVYNIEVDEDHSYICNGMISSNCQDFSVAGKRSGGMEGSGTRSSLCHEWIRIGGETRAKILLFENVPGMMSSNGGRDMCWFLYRLVERGYAVAWRVMDVQHAFTMNFPRAIPQRRRRIWLVASADGDWRTPARILFERSSRLGDVRPTRVLNDGTVVDDPNEGSHNCDDLFSFVQPSGPFFTKDSVADMIPIDLMPREFGGMAANWLRDCGDVRYYGSFWANESESASPDNINGELLKAVGAGAGVAFGNRIVSFKTREWTAGIQMPWGATECDVPKAFDGTVCGLSDVLLPWGDYLGKYLLSKRACEGIVRRAEKRGKELPVVLKDALKEQIGNWDAGALDKYLKREGLVESDEGEECDEEEEGGEDREL